MAGDRARGYRFAARPAWLLGHLLVLAAVVTMILLGHWQLTVSERKGFSLQNFGYALQWWAFSVFAIWLWAKILRDTAAVRRAARVDAPLTSPPVPKPFTDTVAYRRYVMPQSSERSDLPTEDADDPRAAYNAYLRSLAEDGS